MKNNTSKAINAGIGYTIGNYLIKGIAFLSAPLFSRIMSTSEYGMYSTFMAYESIGFIIIGLALHSSYKKAKYHFKDDFNGYVSSTIVLIIGNFIIFTLLVNLINSEIVQILGMDKLTCLFLVMFSFSSAIITCYNSYLSLNYEYKNYILIAAVNALGNVGLSLSLMLGPFEENRYLGRVVGTSIPSFLIAIFISYKLIKIRRPIKNKRNLIWGIKYSLPIIPHGISQVLLNQCDRIMIKNMVNASSAGIYSFAYNIFAILNVTTTSIGTAWEPWIFQKMQEKKYDEIRSKSSYLILGLLIFSILIMLISPELIYILGAKSYHEAIYSVIPIITGGYFSFLYTLPASVEYFHSKTQYIAIGTIAAATINIVLNFYFIKRVGYIAAAYTTLISYFLYFLFHYLLAWAIEKKCLFNSKIIIISSSLIIIGNFLSIYLIEHNYLRYLLIFSIIITGINYEEKTLGIIKNNWEKPKWKI